MSNIKEVRVPDIGNFPEVDVIEVLVKVGDVVKAEDSLVTLESDKATMDIPAPFAGKVTAIRLKAGEKAAEGTLILTMEVNEGAVSQPAAAADSQPVAEAKTAPTPPATQPSRPPNPSPPPLSGGSAWWRVVARFTPARRYAHLLASLASILPMSMDRVRSGVFSGKTCRPSSRPNWPGRAALLPAG